MRDVGHHTPDAGQDGSQTDNGVESRDGLRQIRGRNPLADDHT